MNFLKYITGLNSFSITGCDNLSNVSILSNFTTLQNVTINNAKKLTDLSFCKNLELLRTLNLEKCAISNLQPLKNNFSLVSLNLKDNPLSDMSVDIDDGKNKSNLQVLVNLNKNGNLKNLYIGGNGSLIKDYSILNDGTNWNDKSGWN